MHQQRIILTSFISRLSLIMFATWLASADYLFAQKSASPVVTAVIQKSEIATSQTFVGTVFPMRRSVVGSAVDGRVLEFLVNEGDRVKKGDVIAKLRTQTLEIEIASAEAELALRQFEKEELNNGSRPEELVQAKAKLEGAKALLAYTSSRFTRTESLFKQGQTATQEELDEALSARVAAEQALIATQAAHELAVQGPREEKKKQAQARLMIQEEIVNQLKDRKEKFQIRAPFNGYVSAKHTEVGEWISKADPVVEVIELDPVEIIVYVPEAQIINLQNNLQKEKGEKENKNGENSTSRNDNDKKALVIVHFDATPEKIFFGEVVQIVPQADLRSRAFPVRIRLANPPLGKKHLLKSGMLAKVSLPVGKKQDALLVPKDALIYNQGSISVMVVQVDKKTKRKIVKKVTVSLGAYEKSLIQITSNDPNRDLKEGVPVVILGNERLRPGQEITIIDQNPSPGK